MRQRAAAFVSRQSACNFYPVPSSLVPRAPTSAGLGMLERESQGRPGQAK